MLVFVIPLKSPQVSKSWERVCKLFERCIKSVCNQTSSDFQVIVTCHEKPAIAFSHPNLTYLEVDFPVPPKVNHEMTNTDKGRKILKGLMYGQKFNPSHAMIVDADDCISRRITEFVNLNSNQNGWFINTGYKYQDRSKLVYYKRENFYRMCGTCNIIRYDLLNLPEDGEYNRGYGYYKRFIDHAKMKGIMEDMGKPIEKLPFAGAVYIIESGQNNYFNNKENIFYQNKSILKGSQGLRGYFGEMGKIINCRTLSKSISEEFGLYSITD